jgi:hypothetical protein
VLLHLLRFEKEVFDNIHEDEVDGQNQKFLVYLTQEGIAEGIGTKQSSIFKELHALCLPTIEGEEPLIHFIEKVRIPGRERVCSIYFLTQYGLEMAKQKLNYLEEKNLEVKGLVEETIQVIKVKEMIRLLIEDGTEPNTICALLRIATITSPDGEFNWRALKSPVSTTCDYEIESEQVSQATIKTENVVNPYFNRIAIKDPKYFFGRENEVRYITSLLQNTQSCSIIGPRRIGKSSLINVISNSEILVKNGLNPQNYIFVFIDLEGLGELTQSEFFYLIIEELRNRVVEKDIRELLESVISKEEIRFIDLKKIFRYITNIGKKVIFLFDEFELITSNKNLDCNFFSGLRNLANSYNVGYITASNMPLLELTFSKKTLGSPFFNFFAQIEINLMSEKAVNDMIIQPAKNYNIVFQNYVIDFIKKTAGLHPFFLQMLCFQIFDWITDTGSISEKDFPKVQQLFMTEARPHFQYYWNHLSNDEQQFLRKLSNNTISDEFTGEKFIIQSLKKKALLHENNEGLSLFSNAFLSFISTLNILDEKNIDQHQESFKPEFKPEVTSLEVKPVIEDPRKIVPKSFIEFGNNYFVNEAVPERTISLFKDIISRNIPGLIITRTPLKNVEQKWGITNSTIFWLCSQPGKGNLPPIVGKISHTIIEFIKQNQPSIIFLDGLEFIINNNDFSKTLHLMDNLKEMVAIYNSILVIPMSSTMFSEREMALLCKNFNEISNEVTLDFSKLGIE